MVAEIDPILVQLITLGCLLPVIEWSSFQLFDAMLKSTIQKPDLLAFRSPLYLNDSKLLDRPVDNWTCSVFSDLRNSSLDHFISKEKISLLDFLITGPVFRWKKCFIISCILLSVTLLYISGMFLCTL
jgi:hypothetical protein